MNKKNQEILKEMEKRATPKEEAQTMREDSHRDEEKKENNDILPQCEECKTLTANGKYKTYTEDEDSVEVFLCPDCYGK